MGTGYFGSGVSDLLSRLEEEKKEKEEEQKPIGYIGVKYNPANVEEQSPTITTPEIPEEKSEPLTSKASREFDFDDPSERAAYYQEKIAWLEGIADEKGGQLAESSYEAYRYAIRKYNENVKLINEEVQPTEIKKPRQFEQKGVASRQRGIGELPSSNLQSEDMPKAIQKMDDYITAGIKGVGAGTAGFAESFSQLLVEAGERELALQEGYKPSDRWDVEEKDFIKKLLEAKYGGDRFKKIKGEAATWVSDKGAELVQEAQEWSKQFQLAQDAGEVEKFIYDMTAGGTSLAGALGIAWVTKDPNMAAAIFGLAARGGTYGKAREAGVDPLEAGAYGSQNQFTETILEAVGLELLLTKLPVGKGLSILLKGVGEGSQEWSQGFMGNLIEKYGWNKAKDLTEGLGREALIGFLLGGGTSLVIENLSKEYGVSEKDITYAVEQTYQYLHDITKDTSFQDVIDSSMDIDVTNSDDFLDDYLDKQSTQSILDDIDGREFENIPPQYQPEIPDTVHGTGIEGTFAGKVSAKSPTWSKDIAKAINSGGISYDPIKGDVSGDGYAVSISEKYEHKFTSKDDITKEDVEKFADENKGMLNIEENFIGGWKPEGGNPEINVSTKKATLTEAVLLGKKNNQDAINDLSTFKDIYLRDVKAKEGDEAHANDVVHLFHVSEETRTDIDPEYMSTGQIGREKGQFENVETKALHEGYETKSNWYLEEGKIEARFGGGVLHELYVLKKDLYNKDEKGQKSDTDIKKEGYKGYISQDQARLFTKEIPVVVGKLSINKNESVKVEDAYKYSSPAPEPIFRRDSGIDLSKEPTDTQRREQQKLLDEGKISKQQYNERLGIEEDGQLFKDTGAQESATMSGDDVGDSSTPVIMDDWVTEIPYTDLAVIEDTEYSPTEETKEVRKDYEPIHVPNKTAVLGEDLQFREPTITKWYTPKLELMRNIGVEEILGELPEARQLLDIKATEINHQINEMIVKLKEGSSKKDRFNAWLRNKPIKQVADMRDLLNAYETAPQFLTPKQKETFNLVRDFTKNMLEITNKFREEAGLSKINNLKAYIPHFLDEVAAAAADGKYPYVADVYRWTGKKYKIPNNPTAKGRTVSKITDDLNEVFSKDLGKLLKAMAKYDLRDIYLAIPYAQVRAEIKALKGQIPKATLTELEEYIKYDILDALTPTDESINRFLLPSTNVMNAVLKPFGRVITDPVRLLSGAYRQGLMGGAIAGKPKLVIRNLFQKLLTMDLVPASDYIKAQFSAPTEVMEQIRETTFYKSSVATFEDLPPLMKVVEKGMMPFQKSHAGLKFISNVDVAMRAGYNYGQRMIEWSNSDKGQKYIRDYAKKHDIKKGTKEYNNLFWKEGDQIKEAVEIGSRSQWFYHSTDMPRVFRGQGARAIYSLQSWWMNYFGKHVGEMQKRTFQGKTGRGRVIPKAHRTLSIRGMAIIFGLMSALKRYTGIDMIKYTIFPFPNIKSISHGGKLLVDTYEIFVGNMEEKKTALKNVSKALALLIPFSGAYKQYKEWIIGDISTKQLLFYMEYDNNWKQIWVKTSPKKGVQSKPIGKIGGKSVKIGGTSKGKIGSITKKRIGE